MKCPIKLVVPSYKGSDPHKQVQFQSDLETARRIEDYVNGYMETEPPNSVKEFNYYEFAQALDIEKSIVKKILAANGGGSNEFIVGEKVRKKD